MCLSSQYNTDKAIVDSGTTLLRLPANVFSAVVEAITQTSMVRSLDYLLRIYPGRELWVIRVNFAAPCMLSF